MELFNNRQEKKKVGKESKEREPSLQYGIALTEFQKK